MVSALDLFAGPGGWDVAARSLGISTLGFEWHVDALATAWAAGHERIAGDLAQLDPRAFGPVSGLIASPPCQGFSTAGSGRGRADSIHLLDGLAHVGAATDLRRLLDELTPTMTDARTLLVLEPLRWALALTPSWLAWEQVPAVLPLWDACADVLRRIGYSVATGVLHAEQYGVPQTRNRAILVARAPWAPAPAALPAPTHSRYHVRNPDRLDDGVKPWVSMGEALTDALGGDWSDRAVRSNYGTGGDARARGVRLSTEPAATVTSKVDRNRWVLRGNQKPGGGSTRVDQHGYQVRAMGAPAMTVTGNTDSYMWLPEFADQSGTPVDHTWPYSRPSTTVAAPGLVQNPGATANRFNGSTKSRNDGVRVTVAEAGVLQSFPPDYPWQGTSTAQYQQVGDAIPPLLAAAILEAIS